MFVALPKMCLCLNVSLEIWRKIGQCNQKCSNESSVKCTALISKWCGGGWVHILWCMYILMPTLLASDSFSRHLTLRLSVCVLCQWKNIVVAIKPKPACTTISIVFFPSSSFYHFNPLHPDLHHLHFQIWATYSYIEWRKKCDEQRGSFACSVHSLLPSHRHVSHVVGWLKANETAK